MGQNRLDSTLFLLSLKLSAGDLFLTRICILQHLLFEDINLKKKKKEICKKDSEKICILFKSTEEFFFVFFLKFF